MHQEQERKVILKLSRISICGILLDYDWGVFSTGVTRSDKLSCQPRIPAEFHRDEERKVLNGLVPLLADDIKGQNLGNIILNMETVYIGFNLVSLIYMQPNLQIPLSKRCQCDCH